MGGNVSSYFDGEIPWNPQLVHSLKDRRRQFGGHLFIDRLLQIAELDASSLFPPTSGQTLEQLLRAIEDCYFDQLKKNCLLYYILKYWNDGREEGFARDCLIPPQFAILSDAYWFLDQGYVEPAVYKLCDPRVTPDFVPHILRAITALDDPQHVSRLVLRFVRMGRLVLTGAAEIDIYMDALCGSSMMDAWMYQRTFPEEEGPDSTRPRLLRRIFSYCLYPRVEPESLKALVAFPFTSYEDKQVTAYALKPSQPLSAPALSVLQELIIVRLIHQGRYSEAIRLDRQFVLDASGAARATGAAGAAILAKAAESRRQTIHELMAVLPVVQRKLLEVELGGDLLRKLPSSGSLDLSMSWEDVDQPSLEINGVPLAEEATMSFVTDLGSVGTGPTVSPTAKKHAQPITGTPAFRQSNPQLAVLQAFAQSSRMEGSPSSTTRVATLATSSSSTASPLKSSVALSAPFGTTVGSNPSIAASVSHSAKSGAGAAPTLAKMMNRPTFNIRAKSSLTNSTSASPSLTNSSLPPTATGSGPLPPARFGLGGTSSNAQSFVAPPAPVENQNPFYRPSEDDLYRSAGPSSSRLGSKRSFGQLAQAHSGMFDDVDMDDREPDSEDDVVLNQSIYNPKSVGTLAGPAPPQAVARQANGTPSITPHQNLAVNQKTLAEARNNAEEDEDVGLPGAFPVAESSSKGKADIDMEMDDDVPQISQLPRKSHGRTSQPESAAPTTRRSTRASSQTAVEASPVKRTSRIPRSSRGKEKSKPEETDHDTENEEEEMYGRAGLRRSTRGGTRQSLASITGSPERKKQRSVEPEPVPSGPTSSKKPTRSSSRKSASGIASSASASNLITQPSRMMTRRQQAVIEE